MKALFYLSGILITLSGQFLAQGIKTKKRRQTIMSALVLSACVVYAVYYIFFVD